MLVVYVCPEMLESPSFARLVHSKTWQGRLSAIYIDEAHLIRLSLSWRPSYGRLYQLRNIMGHDIPLIGLSATCPKKSRDAIVTYAGLDPNYYFINLGNYRPELSTIILPIKFDMSSFKDLAFILPFGARLSDLVRSIIYCDDLDLLTNMFWWAFQRAASMGIPTHAIDIIHSGLSDEHQELCLKDFRSGKTVLLLGSSKISAGMNFAGVRRVIQYKCRGLTIEDLDQRRGRGGRRAGETSVGIVFVEPSMMLGGDVSVESPGDQDVGIVELVQSTECAEIIIQRWLENPPHLRNPACDCCNRCDPSLRPVRELQWIPVNPAPSTARAGPKSTAEQRAYIYDALVLWRLEHWRSNWREQWPSYGPKSLITDSDLEDLSKHTHKILAVQDMRPYTHIVHWDDLSQPLFDKIQHICAELNLLLEPEEDLPPTASATEERPRKRRRVAAVQRPGVLQPGEMVIQF